MTEKFIPNKEKRTILSERVYIITAVSGAKVGARVENSSHATKSFYMEEFSESDWPDLKVGTRFVETEFYRDLNGDRAHCWVLKVVKLAQPNKRVAIL